MENRLLDILERFAKALELKFQDNIDKLSTRQDILEQNQISRQKAN
jgi:hypothetical protein